MSLLLWPLLGLLGPSYFDPNVFTLEFLFYVYKLRKSNYNNTKLSLG